MPDPHHYPTTKYILAAEMQLCREKGLYYTCAPNSPTPIVALTDNPYYSTPMMKLTLTMIQTPWPKHFNPKQ